MISFIIRVFIVIVVFLAGVMVGNIFMPQKQLEEHAITAVREPATTLDLAAPLDTQAMLEDVSKIQSVLQTCPAGQENNQNTAQDTKKALLLAAFKAAQYQYKLELLKVHETPEHKTAYIKARDNYLKIIETIEADFPQTSTQIEIIKPQESDLTAEATLAATTQAEITPTATKK
ncbi:MAG: hypothetical protein LBM71_00855 [Elusimicrobiota bacterium]|jgi:hypothetical protein|nr:hypothetical protein [Elusimicrobiota bacterium]